MRRLLKLGYMDVVTTEWPAHIGNSRPREERRRRQVSWLSELRGRWPKRLVRSFPRFRSGLTRTGEFGYSCGVSRGFAPHSLFSPYGAPSAVVLAFWRMRVNCHIKKSLYDFRGIYVALKSRLALLRGLGCGLPKSCPFVSYRFADELAHPARRGRNPLWQAVRWCNIVNGFYRLTCKFHRIGLYLSLNAR